MLKQILRAEVKDVLGRNPTDEELKKFADYVYEAYSDMTRAKKDMFLADIGLLLYECRNANYHQCEDCGEWYEIGGDDWNEDGNYCISCKANADPDFERDLYIGY